MYKLIIADDEESICSSLEFALENEFRISTASSEGELYQLVAREDVDIILLDLRLGISDGLAVLSQIKALKPDVAVIIMTAFGSIKSSVEAMKRGAFYYITKPINIEELRVLMDNITEHLDLKYKVRYLNERLAERHELAGMVGSSPGMQGVFQLIEKVKDIDTNLMITGESGTGKELVVRAIHYTGNRSNQSFVPINCAAIPMGLLESELFGHERGAFTGAVERRKGAFQLAHRGTLFLDEICEMDINLQSKLLRTVQNKEICPVGASATSKVDVRIICATNRDLKAEIAAGRFREDLFYRLNVINVHLPPLRERQEDITILACYFAEKYGRKFGRKAVKIDEKALQLFQDYPYRGNVREMENIIERAVALGNKEYIYAEDLPLEMRLGSPRKPNEDRIFIPVYAGEDLASIEKRVILQTLRYVGGNKRETAQLLKISERNLRYKLKDYRQETADFAAGAKLAEEK